ncbi:putative immunity protein [Nocardia sp. NPDC050697]|uniref:putative immunity protein n=1 Tax=Nocardia sp. NPDC050697 TaxID=3155158 RepID=UPI0033CB0B62
MDLDELRAVTAYAVTCAEPALIRFERHRPGDPRARLALEAAREFAGGGPRTKAIRDAAWAAQRAYGEARDAGQRAASEAARSAVAAASAAYLHPIAKATQVWHILGAAAHAAYAAELDGEPAPPPLAPSPAVVAVLRRYPPAPAGRGRAGELLRELDRRLRP